ncbi:MAG: precorrin-6y C5,15-methyltransferase (decarboxylating) subunit CbiE [Nitrosomonadales bacterium]|nr:precorrin-6y C5,15-methyltransferase (decarboxylating) subunit CbiE [Nitrosomonadales bacterium]
MILAKPCSIIGILDDGWIGLPEIARMKLATASCVIGAGRTLELVAPHLAAQAKRHDMDGALLRVPEWITAALSEGQQVAVLATGDPLCHGIASLLLDKIGAASIEILPAISTVQLAFARLGRPWQQAQIISVHGKDAGEWATGATPQHGLYALVRAVAEHDLFAVFTSPENGPERIARALLAAGYGDDLRLSVAARLLLPDEEVSANLSLSDAAACKFATPNIVVIERIAPQPRRAIFGFADEEYAQRQPEKGLITKLEVRAASIAKLGLTEDSIVWDIGACSGSVGLEAARIARRGHVWAIEKNAEDVTNARENAKRLRATNYTLLEGKAPDQLDTWPDPDAVFIGGSGGELATLIQLALSRLKPGGRLVINFVTLENLATATRTLAAAGADWDVVQLQAARSQPILDMHRLAAQNPVWIVTATRKLNDQRCIRAGLRKSAQPFSSLGMYNEPSHGR